MLKSEDNTFIEHCRYVTSVTSDDMSNATDNMHSMSKTILEGFVLFADALNQAAILDIYLLDSQNNDFPFTLKIYEGDNENTILNIGKRIFAINTDIRGEEGTDIDSVIQWLAGFMHRSTLPVFKANIAQCVIEAKYFDLDDTQLIGVNHEFSWQLINGTVAPNDHNFFGEDVLPGWTTPINYSDLVSAEEMPGYDEGPVPQNLFTERSPYIARMIDNFGRGWLSINAEDELQSALTLYILDEEGETINMKMIFESTTFVQESDSETNSSFFETLYTMLTAPLGTSVQDDVVGRLELSYYERDDEHLDKPTMTYGWIVRNGKILPDYDTDDVEAGWIVDPDVIRELKS